MTPLTIFTFLTGPLGRYLMIGLVVVGAFMWSYRAGYSARDQKAQLEQAAAREQFQKEVNDAVARARAARDGVVDGRVPDHDPNLRD
jgi:hypothetical protein